jgi:DNA-directed RNA polymerase subunit M/transcription elongation factor TFIIS
MTIYDLLDISVGGEEVSARPVEWSGEDEGEGLDASGVAITVTKYVSTCPKCAQLMEFSSSDVVKNGEASVVICQSCGAGPSEEQRADGVKVVHVETDDRYVFSDNQAVPTPGNEPAQKEEAVEEKKDKITIKPTSDDCPFQDPVEAGELRPAKA